MTEVLSNPASQGDDAIRAEPADVAVQPGKLLRLKLIGPMEAWTVGSDSVLPLGRKTRALLAILALAAPRPLARVRLAELLWSRRPEEPARASLRQEIHRLVEALHPIHADILMPSRDRIALNADLVWLDVDVLLRASVAEPAGLALLKGGVLEGFDGIDPAFDTWLAAERERIRDRARNVAEALLRERMEPGATITAAKQLLSLDRAHEGAWRALMLSYTALGERGLAVQAFEQCRAVLADLLNAAPSPETQRLIAEIRGGSAPGRTASSRAETLPPRCQAGAKFGVLPLRTSGGSAEETHLALDLAEEITAAMARFRWLCLVSASSLAQFGGRDQAALRQTFELDLLLDGSLQRAGDTMRIALQLLDLRDGGTVVWTQRLDRPAQGMTVLPNEAAADLAAQLDPAILQIEGSRAAGRPLAEASAYDLTLRALPLLARLGRDEFSEAGRLLSHAIGLDPDFAAAHAWRAYWLAFAVGQGWAMDADTALREAGQHADRALALDPQDARSLAIIGHVRAYVHQQPREALKFHERALVLNPNLAMAWGFAAVTYTYLGDLPEAARRFERYQRLCPIDTNAFFFESSMALLAFQRRDYAEAIRLSRRSSTLKPGFASALKHYLAALGQAGAKRQAAEVLARLLAIDPRYSVARFLTRCPFDRDADREHYAEGLRLGGMR